jgi:hypothetical protein
MTVSASSAGKDVAAAPVALFCYARPDHTRRTLDALARNTMAGQTDLIVFQDGLRSDTDRTAHAQVTPIVERTRGFRSLRIVRRPRNLGLADNIADGVTQAVSEYGRVIVMEDDLVTAPGFLAFLNAGLERYAQDERVWHISGWSYPIAPDGLGDCYFQRVMNCWGWATWADRWSFFSRDPAAAAARFDKDAQRRFNLDDAHDFHAQIRQNLNGSRRTWAIFWYETIFRHHGLCLNPAQSLVLNIGHDGSGENCGDTIDQAAPPDKIADWQFPDLVAENPLALGRMRALLRPGPLATSLRKLRKVFAA